MKICIIASKLFFGGFTTSMLNAAHELKRNGIQVDLMFIKPEEHALDLNLVKDFHVMNIERIHQHKKNILFTLKQKKQKKEYQKLQQQIDYSSCESEKRLLEQRLLQISIQNEVKDNLPHVDLREYDAVISWEELNSNYFLAFNVIAKNKIGFIHPDYQTAGFDATSDLKALEQLDHIVGVSESTTQTLKNVFPSLTHKIVCVHNILDTHKMDQFSNAFVPYEKSKMDIVCVSRILIEGKGLDRLIRVTKKLNTEGYAFAVHIIGGGQELEKLKAMIFDEQISNIYCYGEQENPYPYIKLADLFILLTLTEGKPMVIDEAMYLNTPVFVTEYTSAHEQIDDGVNGIIAKQDEEDIYHKLKYLMDHIDCLNIMRGKLLSEDKSKYTDLSSLKRLISSKH